MSVFRDRRWRSVMRGVKYFTRTGVALVALFATSPAWAEDPFVHEPLSSVATVSDDELEAQRAGHGVPVSEATLTATFEDNTITSSLTGDNTIAGSAFTGASGFFTVIQNSGNGVIIQDSTIINLSLE